MPSTTTLLININLPPIGCKLSLSPRYGISFDTEFKIKIDEC